MSWPPPPARAQLPARPPLSSPFTSEGAWSSVHLGLLGGGLLGPSTTGGHRPPDTSLGVFLYLPVGMLTGLQSGLLGKVGVNSSGFGLGVPTCHGKSTGTHAAVSQLRHLVVGESMYTLSRFSLSYSQPQGLCRGCSGVLEGTSTMASWLLILQRSAQMSPCPRGRPCCP